MKYVKSAMMVKPHRSPMDISFGQDRPTIRRRGLREPKRIQTQDDSVELQEVAPMLGRNSLVEEEATEAASSEQQTLVTKEALLTGEPITENDTQAELAKLSEGSSFDEHTQIAGIGPKIAAALQSAGISSFSQLAQTEVRQLVQILKEAAIHANPETWPEQAAVAIHDSQ